jgi:para-nitrobenzyl esterase
MTSAGPVAGTLLPSGVRAYLGVRYAMPPTQERRWKPPAPAKWSGIWVADRKGAECIQVLRPHTINHYFGEETSGEDCLYLNIWTPSDARPGSHLPVVAFIYGGGGTIGSAGMALYDGESVARHGAVFVNFNYRVGALGFMAHPDLTKEQGGHSGNYGYLDQLAALRWIHTNIAAFGGDPARVLISGQSFGAGSVAAHIFSPLSKGLFRAAAMWSACNFTTSGPDLATAEQAGLELQRRLGAANLEEMRAVPADRILAQQAESQLGVSVSGIRTPPLIDGYFVTGNKDELLRSHRFNDVPMLVSSNGDDLDAAMSVLTRATTVEQWRDIVQRMYGSDATTFLTFFPVSKDVDVYDATHMAARENGMLGASRVCAEGQAKYGTSHTYISLFTRKHPYVTGVQISDQNTDTVGAYHTADVPYWFNTLSALNMLRETRNWTADDGRLSEVMMRSLIQFARTGSPDVPEWSWPAWSPSDERFTVLDIRIRNEPLKATRMDWLAAHSPAKVEQMKILTPPRD